VTHWGLSLASTKLLDPDSLRRLQALAITTVEELQAALVASPEQVSSLVPDKSLSAFGLMGSRPRSLLFAGDFDSLPTLGAEPPGDVTPLPRASEEFFFASLEGLGPEPDEAVVPPVPIAADRVDCITCMRPVRDQGLRSTCVAHAVAAAFECLLARSTGASVDLSPQFLYWAAKQNDGRPGSPGTLISVAVDRAVSDGVCDEVSWPYSPVVIANNEGQDPPPAGALAAAGAHRATAPVAVAPRSSAALRAMLDRDIPVPFSVPLYAYWASPNGKVAMPIPGAPLLGGHAICAVGYLLDPSAPGGGFIIAKNSWGTSRTPASPIQPGYYCLPFDYIDMYGWESRTLS
jgi:Papain family cysteine protease